MISSPANFNIDQLIKNAMQKRCLGCKREIARDLRECHFCGAPQSITRYYRNSVIFFIAFLAASVYGLYYLLQIANQQALNEQTQLLSETKTQSQKQLDSLQVQLDEAQAALEQANKAVAENEADQSSESAKLSQQLVKLKKALTEAENEAKKQSERAGWLSRENSRLKDELKEAKAQLKEAHSTSITQPKPLSDPIQ